MLLGNDTVLAITYKQLVVINKDLNRYSHLLVKDSLLETELTGKDKIITLKDSLLSNKDKEISIKEQKFLAEKSSLEKEYKSIIKKNKKKGIFTSCGVGVAGVLVGFIIRMLMF